MSALEAKAVAIESGPKIALIRASGIRCTPIRWLWPGWLARGKLHILAGAPGTGKTTIAIALAATQSCGGRWPDGSKAMPGNVLIWSGEDDAADTIVPRLKAAGADLSRVFIVGDVHEGIGARPFDPASDLALIESAAARIGDVALLIADPVVNAVGAADSHKNVEVRRALQPLVEIGHRLGCALIGITHFSKGTAGRDPTERVNGSIAFGALARIVIVAAKRSTEGDGPQRIFARSKSNIGPDGGGYGYELVQVDVGDGIAASAVTWREPMDGTARELLGEAEAASDTPKDEATDWLADVLAAGPVAVKELKTEAKAAGLSWRTVENAKAELGAKASRVSAGNDGGGFWQWSLPNTAIRKTASPNPSELRSCQNVAATRVSGTSEGARPQDRNTGDTGGLAVEGEL